MYKWLLLLALMASTCYGQVSAVIEGPQTVLTGQPVKLDASKSTGSKFVWKVLDKKLQVYAADGNKTLFWATPTPGEYTFLLFVGGKDRAGELEIADTEYVVTVISNGPSPVPVPVPPTPTPVPPAPIPGGFRVLILKETADYANYSQGHLQVLNSTVIRQYLHDKCAKLNGHPEYRYWDQSYGPNDLPSQGWKEAFERAKQDSQGKLPWIMVTNGVDAGESVPLPETVEETMALLRKYGG